MSSERKLPDWASSIQAVGTSIAVVELNEEKVSEGGIHLPSMSDTEKRMFKRGLVISVGDGAVALNGETVPNDCKVGDVVRFFQVGEIQVDYYGNQRFFWVDNKDVRGVEV